jgi:hypothetical protein
MKQQDNRAPPKVQNFSITESKDIEMVEMLVKESESLVFKMINDVKENSNKHMRAESMAPSGTVPA